MKCVKRGVKNGSAIFTGRCRQCKAEFEAARCELTVIRCPREHYEFAHADCSECGGRAGNAVILYPKS